ncbi:T9SS type A sorting domain-containing protein [bacterium SCSIO 12741]|nr:T9SS type A sorting domain-containing protein [bacterium SCSIO 12741]
MKKWLLLLTSVLLTTTTFAQITLTIDHIAKLGDYVYMAEDTTHGSSLSLGSAAGNQVWDFTSLESQELDTALLQSPSTAPLSSHFPTATFVLNDLEDSSHIFFKRSAVGLDVVGIVEYENGAPQLPEVNYAFRFMQFPVTFGSTFESDINAGAQIEFLGVDPDSLGPHPRIDSIRNKIFIKVKNEIDAWGDLKLPQGTFPALRQRTVTVTKVSSDAYMNGSWQPFTPLILAFTDSVNYDTSEVTFRWWSSNAAANFMCAEVTLDSNELPEDFVNFLVAPPANELGTAESISSRGIEVFPNPVSDQLTISSQSHSVQQIQLISTSGELVLIQKTEAGQIQVNVSEVPDGVYLLLLQGHADQPMVMRKVQIRH